jgi:hypothetical protein
MATNPKLLAPNPFCCDCIGAIGVWSHEFVTGLLLGAYVQPRNISVVWPIKARTGGNLTQPLMCFAGCSALPYSCCCCDKLAHGCLLQAYFHGTLLDYLFFFSSTGALILSLLISTISHIDGVFLAPFKTVTFLGCVILHTIFLPWPPSNNSGPKVKFLFIVLSVFFIPQ